MAKVARIFDQQTSPSRFEAPSSHLQDNRKLPWDVVRENELPPMMFQLRYQNGRISSYSYGNLHEIQCPDAGCVQLHLFSLQKLIVTIEGRHLRELAHLLSNAMIRAIKQSDPRDLDVPECDPEIVSIKVEAIEE